MTPTWLEFVRSKTGEHELDGLESNPFILECLDTCDNIGPWAKGRDETAWCSALINLSMIRCGYVGTNHALASSWLDWGMEMVSPMFGCVTVIRRKGGRADAATGSRRGYHVSLFLEAVDDGLWLHGGNQRNKVGQNFYPLPKYDVLAYRWPVVRQ